MADRAGDTEEGEVRQLTPAGTEGRGGQPEQELGAQGFTVMNGGKATAASTTSWRCAPGQEAQARTLAGELPSEPPVEEDDGVNVVTLVLGSSG